jgi:hypothetical protein
MMWKGARRNQGTRAQMRGDVLLGTCRLPREFLPPHTQVESLDAAIMVQLNDFLW